MVRYHKGCAAAECNSGYKKEIEKNLVFYSRCADQFLEYVSRKNTEESR